MGSPQQFPNEELIKSLCVSATSQLREGFPNHERLWSACNHYPRVDFTFEPTNDRLIVKYSMIFRRAGGKIYRSVTSNRIYRNALETIPPEGIRVIIEGWTRDFVEKVNHAKAIRDEIVLLDPTQAQ